jgi:hypothetical protein
MEKTKYICDVYYTKFKVNIKDIEKTLKILNDNNIKYIIGGYNNENILKNILLYNNNILDKYTNFLINNTEINMETYKYLVDYYINVQKYKEEINKLNLIGSQLLINFSDNDIIQNNFGKIEDIQEYLKYRYNDYSDIIDEIDKYSEKLEDNNYYTYDLLMDIKRELELNKNLENYIKNIIYYDNDNINITIILDQIILDTYYNTTKTNLLENIKIMLKIFDILNIKTYNNIEILRNTN